MMRNSITFKLLSLIIGVFILSAVGILFTADKQLTRIIDDSQHVLFEERLGKIVGILDRSNERLKKTGMVDAYIDEFKRASLKVLQQAYYNNTNQLIYPFIIDGDGVVVMHPILTAGDTSLVETEIVRKMLSASNGDFNYTYRDQKKWCHFLRFPAWNWIIGYTIPLDIKYSDAREFRDLLVTIMGGMTFIGTLLLAFLITRFTRPIVRLTNISKAIAEGDLSHHIDTEGRDEVGILARSFSYMRDAIHQKISELERENLERSRAEEKLVQQNEYMNTIMESVSHPLYVIDVNDYTIKMANSASGIHLSDKSTCYAETHRRDNPCCDSEHPCPLEIVKETHEPSMVEHVHFDKNGNLLNVEVYAYPVFDHDGELVQMIEYCIDVTERKQALRDFADEKERLSVTLRSIGDGVITTDISGNIVLINKVAEKLTGWSNDDANGQPLEDVFHIVHEQTGKACENPATLVINSSQVVGLGEDTVLIARDGIERNIADSGAPIFDTESNIIGVVLVFRDVTEQLKTEKELLKVKKLESIGVLAGGIAHDFNNILAAILGNINLAQFDNDLKDRTRKLLADAEKASLRAKNLTQQLLTFAKGGDPVKETSSLKNVIKDSASFVLHGGKTACQYKIPEDLWLVDIDKGQIGQVIQNIVLNGSHAMPEGGIIKITCENIASGANELLPGFQDGKYVKVSIKDSGVGIPANALDKIFDPYFSTKQEGSGLGLAIAQSILSKHSGHILVESTTGVGSIFTLYLPASKNIKATQQLEAAKAGTAAIALKILVMDDEEMIQTVAQEMLVQLGYEVVLAADGEETVLLYREEMATDSPFDLVIMDLTIPGGMGGKETVLELLKIDPKVRAVVSSGYSNDPVMANYNDHGFCAAIVKPYRLQDLNKVISQIVD